MENNHEKQMRRHGKYRVQRDPIILATQQTKPVIARQSKEQLNNQVKKFISGPAYTF